MTKKLRWGWVAFAFLLGLHLGDCSSPAHAESKSQETRALERIARALEGKCR